MSAYLPIDRRAGLKPLVRGLHAPSLWFAGLLAVGGTLLVAAIVLTGTRPSPTPELTALPLPSVSGTTPVLRTNAAQATRELGYVTLVGEVENISAAPMKNVEVVAELFNSAGKLCQVESALLEIPTLRPGEQTPFRLEARDQDMLTTYRLRFRHLSGASISARQE